MARRKKVEDKVVLEDLSDATEFKDLTEIGENIENLTDLDVTEVEAIIEEGKVSELIEETPAPKSKKKVVKPTITNDKDTECEKEQPTSQEESDPQQKEEITSEILLPEQEKSLKEKENSTLIKDQELNEPQAKMPIQTDNPISNGVRSVKQSSVQSNTSEVNQKSARIKTEGIVEQNISSKPKQTPVRRSVKPHTMGKPQEHRSSVGIFKR